VSMTTITPARRPSLTDRYRSCISDPTDAPQIPASSCRVCGKRYARSDVLTRHLVQTHGEPAATIGRPRKSAW
jgi:uncharacterized Zn-finger protein